MTDQRATDEVRHTGVWKDYETVMSDDAANKKDASEEGGFARTEVEHACSKSQLKNNNLTVLAPRLVGSRAAGPAAAIPGMSRGRQGSKT